MFALVMLLAVLTSAPSAAGSAAERYGAALERMRATQEPNVAVYHAKLSVPGGNIVANSTRGTLYLRFGQGVMGPSIENFFVRTDRDRTEFLVLLPEQQKALARVSLLNATWQGIESWIRYGFEPDALAPSPTPLPDAPNANGDLRVISVVSSFGLAFYDASDGGTESCGNGDPGHAIKLSPRGKELEHPLRGVTIDDTTGLFCTMRFVAPAQLGYPYTAIANVTLHLGEIDGYLLIQDEAIDMIATAAQLPDQHSSATMTFDGFIFPGNASPASAPTATPKTRAIR